MRKLLTNRSITFITIFIYMILTIIIIVILFSFFQSKLKNIVIDNTYQQNIVDVTNITNYIDKSFESYETLIKGVGYTLEEHGDMTDIQIEAYITELLEADNYLLSLEILDENMVVTHSFPETVDTVGYDMSIEINSFNIDTEMSFAWTSPYTSAYETEPFMSVIYHHKDNYYIANYSIYFIDELYQNIKENTPEKLLMIHNGYGIFVYDSELDKELHRIRCKNFDSLKANYLGETQEKILIVEEEDYIVATEYLENQNWYVTLYEPIDSSRQLFITITTSVTVIYSILIVIYFLTILSINYMVQNNLNTISEKINLISDGNFGVHVDKNLFKDFDLITNGFNEMSDKLRKSRSRLEELAYYDQLTGLHSRNYLVMKFIELINKVSNVFVVYMDINRFKLINDIYGYDFGNQILIALSKRLKDLPIKDAYAIKSESDEFILLLNGDNLITNIDSTMTFIKSNVEAPYKINNIDTEISVNMGISIYPDHAHNVETLVNNSIIAMHEAKADTIKSYKIFDESRREEFARKIEIEASLDKAFKQDEFYPVFQPIVYANTAKIRGFEILSRWDHPILGSISPGEFIPILEHTHKISRLDRTVLEKGIEKAQYIIDKLGYKYIVSINLSVETILVEDFVTFVKTTLNKTNFNPKYLELEVTESTIIQDFELVSKKINELKKIGVRFAEDDFGDGFSALNYITQLNLDTLKISYNITKSLLKSKSNKVLLKFIISLAKEFNFETVIEGVEDKETLEICKSYGCTYIQGYYFYKPMIFKELYKVVKSEGKGSDK